MKKKVPGIDPIPPGWHRQYLDKDERGRSRVVYVRGEKRVRSPRDAWNVYKKEHGIPPEPVRRQVVTDADIIDLVINEEVVQKRLLRLAVIEDEVEMARVTYKKALKRAMQTSARGRKILAMFSDLQADDVHGGRHENYHITFSLPYNSERNDDEVRGQVIISQALGKQLKVLKKVADDLQSEQYGLRQSEQLTHRRMSMHRMLKEDEAAMTALRGIVEAALVKRNEAKAKKAAR